MPTIKVHSEIVTTPIVIRSVRAEIHETRMIVKGVRAERLNDSVPVPCGKGSTHA